MMLVLFVLVSLPICEAYAADYTGYTGWQTTGSSTYYYENGEKVFSAFRTIDGSTYFFKKSGKRAEGICFVTTKDEDGIVSGEKFYVFRKNGTYNAAKTKKIRKAAKYKKSAQTLIKLLGTPKSIKKNTGLCIGNGKGRTLKYENFEIQTYYGTNGKECYLSASSNKQYVTRDEQGASETVDGTAGSTNVVDANYTGFYVDGKGRRFYYESGNLVTGWKEINGETYRFAVRESENCKLGQARTGVVKIKGKYYYFNDKGVLKKTLGEDRGKTRLLAQKILDSITTDDMSKSEKLYRAWKYCTSRSRFSYSSSKYPNLSKKGWQVTTAYDMLKTKKGNCYSFACAFAALAKEIGYEPYVICGRVSGSRDRAGDGMTRHCWVKINGKYYDPEGKFAGWYTTCYKKSSYGISHTIQKTVKF